MTTPRALFALGTHLLSWAFCLYVGGQMGIGWGAAALLIFELRAYGAAASAARYFGGRNAAD